MTGKNGGPAKTNADASKRRVNLCIIDDEESFVTVLKEELARQGFEVSTALNGRDGIKLLEEKAFDVCLLDLNMPYLNGLEVLKKASQQAIPTEFIILTAYAAVQTAVESIRLGAYDYVTKPCNLERIMLLIRKAYEKRLMKQESLILKKLREGRGGFITKNERMQKILREADKVAKTDASVLILGESGTGKELLAEYIHANSLRHSGPFIAFNSAAIQETLLESELFGYEKGAFTGAGSAKEGLFELADGGTIFLDEIGEIPQQMQVKLLRVIEKGSFYKVGGTKEFQADARVITATNQDLRKMAEESTFREDLYYRLSSVTLTLPPLRERKDDIPLLVENFISRLPVGYKKSVDDEALGFLLKYDWPGNIRELQNVLNRAAILSDSGRIRPEDLPAELTSSVPRPVSSESMSSLESMEKEHISRVLNHTGGQRKKTAEILGIDTKTLYRKIKRYRLES